MALDRLIRRLTVTPGGTDPYGGQGPVTITDGPRVWAERADEPSQDDQTANQTLHPSTAVSVDRYTVRAESGAWAVGDLFRDEDGIQRTVEGVSPIGGAASLRSQQGR